MRIQNNWIGLESVKWCKLSIDASIQIKRRNKKSVGQINEKKYLQIIQVAAFNFLNTSDGANSLSFNAKVVI